METLLVPSRSIVSNADVSIMVVLLVDSHEVAISALHYDEWLLNNISVELGYNFMHFYVQLLSLSVTGAYIFGSLLSTYCFSGSPDYFIYLIFSWHIIWYCCLRKILSGYHLWDSVLPPLQSFCCHRSFTKATLPVYLLRLMYVMRLIEATVRRA